MDQGQGSQPKKSNMGLVIVIIVVVLIILGAGGYLVWRYLAGKFTSAVTASPSPAVTVTVTASPTTQPSLRADKTLQGDYVIADSDSRLIKEEELVDFTPWELKVARNEIYARHGRPFVHKDLQCYFATKDWYEIDPNYSESMLSDLEHRNVATILAHEEKIDSPILQKDTGC